MTKELALYSEKEYSRIIYIKSELTMKHYKNLESTNSFQNINIAYCSQQSTFFTIPRVLRHASGIT